MVNGIALTLELLRQSSSFLDHLIRPRQHIGRDRQTDLFSRFQVDDQLKLRRLLHRQISRLGTFQDFVDVRGSAAGIESESGPYDMRPPDSTRLVSPRRRLVLFATSEHVCGQELVLGCKREEKPVPVSGRSSKYTVKILRASNIMAIRLTPNARAGACALLVHPLERCRDQKNATRMISERSP